MAAPVEAGVVIDFGRSDENGSGIIIIPSRQLCWDYPSRGVRRLEPSTAQNRRYRHSQFYDHFYDPRYRGSNPRHRHGRYYYPRRSFIQFGIGF